jgi:nitrite reductase/ring-hydroxylating ferredoxin subunit
MAFVEIASSEEISADRGKAFEIEGRKIAIFRRGGEIHALEDSCPHQGGPLSEGSCKEGKVICPWHRWSFDVQTGACETQADKPARIYPVQEVDGKILVDLQTEEAPPVPEAPSEESSAKPTPREVKPGSGFGYLAKQRGEAVKDLLSFLGKSGANLEPKTKFLIYIALQTANFSPRGLRQYIPKAIKAGASEDEILDAILQAYPSGGLGNVVDAVDVFLSLGFGEVSE